MKTFKWEIILARGEIPPNRDEHTAILYENTMVKFKFYCLNILLKVIFGGFINNGEKVNDIYRYYFRENKWEKVLLLG